MDTMQADELLEVFGGNVRRFRVALGLTQEQLADQLGEGSAGSYVSDVERGKKAPNLRTVAEFSKALGVEPNVLMSRLNTKAVA